MWIDGEDQSVGMSADKLNRHHIYEYYQNHLGATDNFTETGNGGGGSATADATNHEMDLATSGVSGGYAYFRAKPTWGIASPPIIYNAIIRPDALGANKYLISGLSDGWAASMPNNGVFIYIDASSNINFVTRSGGTSTTTDIGDAVLGTSYHFYIVASSTDCKAYLNGSLLAIHTTNIPTGVSLYAGTKVWNDSTENMLASVDFLSIRICKV